MSADSLIDPRIDPRNPAPAPGQSRPPQLLALTSVRFFAALHVTLYHLVRPFSLWGPFAGFIASGYTGVSFFFFLSGFILTYSHAAERDLGSAFIKRFYFARFARIYPVYLLSILAAAWILREQFTHRIHILAFVADLFMVQTWSLRMVSFFNVPAWSVSAEVFFYLVFPWVFLRLQPSNRTRATLAVAGFWLLAMIAPIIGLIYFPAGSWTEAGGMFAFWVRRCPLFSLPEFLAGVSLAWLYLRFRPKPRSAFILLVAPAIVLAVVLFYGEKLPALMLHNGLLIPLYAVLMLGLAQNNWLTRALSWAPLVLLGEASYALYLTHFLFGVWLGKAFHVDMGLMTLLWKLAIIIPVSVLLHLLVERPSRKALLRWWNREHPVPARR